MKLLGAMLLSVLAFGQAPADRKADRVISIAAERFTFNPSRVTVKQGELIEFVLTSDDTDHGFRIPIAGIDISAVTWRGDLKSGSPPERIRRHRTPHCGFFDSSEEVA